MKIVLSNLRFSKAQSEPSLQQAIVKLPGFKAVRILSLRILKESKDHRKKRAVLCYTVEFEIHPESSADWAWIRKSNKHLHFNLERDPPSAFPSPPFFKDGKSLRAIVVGMGPAGLFAADCLNACGFEVTLLERGKSVEERDKDVAELFARGVLNPHSNLCFGEGGAGTYSDGKLTTRKNHPFIRQIFHKFAELGAPSSILTSGKPHIGTDRLHEVARNFRKTLMDRGVRIAFEEQLLDFEIFHGKIRKALSSRETHEAGIALVLAAGHSARDTFRMLHARGLPLAAKSFAMGLRCEHSQEWLNIVQHGKAAKAGEPADYRLVHNLSDARSAFSFCMCPGGQVVCATAQENHLAVNGMSDSRREGRFANGALVVKAGAGDYGSSDPLAGIDFQEKWEQIAFRAGGGSYGAPAQRITDFLAGKASANLPFTTYRPGVTACDLNELLPPFVRESLHLSLPVFNRKIKGFVSNEAILIGIESRTSSPVRILRNAAGASPAAENLYPAGEGAGYAGGIVSSALDGILTAQKIAEKCGRSNGTWMRMAG